MEGIKGFIEHAARLVGKIVLLLGLGFIALILPNIAKSFGTSIFELMASVLMVIGLYFLVFRFEDIKKFKFGHLEIELREKIREADSLIKMLKKITFNIGNAAVSNIASSQLALTEQLTPDYCHFLIEEIRNAAKEIGVKIDEPIWKRICLWRYVYKMLQDNTKDDVATVGKFFDEEYYKSDFPASLKVFMNEKGIKYDESIFRLIEYFSIEGEHKDPDSFTNNILSSKLD